MTGGRIEYPQVFAIIPAAGRSTRMGQPKQLLPVGDRPMLEWVIETVLQGHIAGLCVVTSSDVDEALLLGEDPRYVLAINDDPTSEMLDSVRLGLEALTHACDVTDTDGYLVCPGDMPLVLAEDVEAVTYEYRRHPQCIAIASHGGRRGHPMAFPAALASELATLCERGLNALPDLHPGRVRLVERDSDGVLRDVNTPAEFERLRQQVYPPELGPHSGAP
jgi:molybdenum cofactor cytidylyltransferase